MRTYYLFYEPVIRVIVFIPLLVRGKIYEELVERDSKCLSAYDPTSLLAYICQEC